MKAHGAERVLGVAFVLLFLGQAVLAGKLSDFQLDSVIERESAGGCKRQGSHDGDGFMEFILEALGQCLLFGGEASWARVQPSPVDADLLDVSPRNAGEAVIPFARLDIGYQNVESDVEALDWRLEGGYGPIGIHFDRTRYREDNPRDDLALTRVYGLYRMSFGSEVEVDIGLGTLMMDGEMHNDRFSLTLPLLIHPSESVGVEFRPAWATNVADYDLALLLGARWASLKLGWRWVRSPNSSLDGPYAGVSLHF